MSVSEIIDEHTDAGADAIVKEFGDSLHQSRERLRDIARGELRSRLVTVALKLKGLKTNAERQQ